MKSLRKFIYLICLIPLIFPLNSISQNTEPQDTSRIKLISTAREIMNAAGTCALITLDEQGCPRVRAMDPFAPEKDLSVWFGTNPNTRKVSQIKQDPRVTLYYLDSDASGYVLIHGIAQVIDDEKEKEKRWKDEWKAFYPNKPEGYVLIEVTPEWMEVLSYTHGVFNDSLTWQPPMVLFNSQK